MKDMELEKKNVNFYGCSHSWRRSRHLEEKNSKISDEESRHLKHLAKIRLGEF